jgi:hypothetical protein
MLWQGNREVPALQDLPMLSLHGAFSKFLQPLPFAPYMCSAVWGRGWSEAVCTCTHFSPIKIAPE